MDNLPCEVVCTQDGDQVMCLIGPNLQEGDCGFGNTLSDALRDLADNLEK